MSLPPAEREAVMNVADAMQECKSVEEVKEMLATSEKGVVLSSPENYKLIFMNDPLLAGAFSNNLLTNQIDIVKDLGWYRESEGLTDVDIEYIVIYLDKNYHLSSEKKINGAIKVAANEHRHHPIREYLNALEWDGQERVRYALHHFLGAEVNDYTYKVLRLFMLGAASRVFEPGTKFEYMLCLVGDQGAGKSTFFRFLALQDEWFSDDLRRLDDENVYRRLRGHWIIEMSEMLATANARSIEDIKSFLSRQRDNYKVPYEVHPKDYRRQCVFAGTSNTLDFLPLDRSGNRRFLPVQVNLEEAEVHILADEAASRAYINQMWAEIMTEYRKGGFSLTLDRETEMYLRELQTEFMPEDTVAVDILNYLENYRGDIVCSGQLYYEALGHSSYERAKNYETREINSIMNNLAKEWRRFNNPRRFPAPYGRQKGWERIPEEGSVPEEGSDDPGNDDGFEDLPDSTAEQLSLPEEWMNPPNE